ncbi:hypothetical protein M426DRAFT_144350 [Hypoxylon sp. CI-4A]|nr:hypothetical protein M426DRAFT_144350 [Hypoxylon sp. CI-4A]
MHRYGMEMHQYYNKLSDIMVAISNTVQALKNGERARLGGMEERDLEHHLVQLKSQGELKLGEAHHEEMGDHRPQEGERPTVLQEYLIQKQERHAAKEKAKQQRHSEIMKAQQGRHIQSMQFFLLLVCIGLLFWLANGSLYNYFQPRDAVPQCTIIPSTIGHR